MKHWILGLDEDGDDRDLVVWLENQADPDEIVREALRAFAFPKPTPVSPRVRRALAALRSAVEDVEAAAGWDGGQAAASVQAETAAAREAAPEPEPLPDDVVDSKIGKLLDFQDDRESDAGAEGKEDPQD
ncbi:MAG: hypothetical protein ACM3ZA_12745 [Bacillota bacterium]